ncbi:hypothetical protein ACIRVF_01200 [Kitasatospora sp. NPDC101157]|uniref:hypothetical protein n=1 Tax=Kitasatospora sp. NPDC101157 TaxID=3364098 RepID=UPI003828587B
MAAEDEFEGELSIRLGARAAGIGGSPPLAELREAGRRRARRQRALRGVAAGVLAVLAAGGGALTQLGGGGGGGGGAVTGPAALAVASPTASPTGNGMPLRGAETDERVKAVLSCKGGPSSAPASDRPGRTDLVAAGQAVERMARQEYGDHYFATCLDTAAGTLVVMRNPGPTGLDAAVSQVVAEWPAVQLRFVAAPSYPSQLTLAKEIRAEAGDWAATRGVHIAWVEIGLDGKGVIVHTPQAETARAEIVREYGHLVSVGP